MAMLYEQFDHPFEVKHFRATVYEGNVVHAKWRLKCAQFVKLVEYNVRVSISFDIHHDTHTLAIRLIIDVRDSSIFSLIPDQQYV